MPRKKPESPTSEGHELPDEPGAVCSESTDESGDAEDRGASTGHVPQAVTFTLGGQLYAVPIEAVQEIQQIVEMLPLPDSTRALVGLIDLRGTVVPAIDLRALVGVPAAEFRLETPMVFCYVRDHVVALIVDGVEDVVDLPEGCVQPPSALYSMADRMIGVARLDSGLVPLLDVDRLVPESAFCAAGGGLR